MRAPWRLLIGAAALNLIVAAAAAAQTVIVTKAPPGSTIELVLNSTVAATVKADAAGVATIPITPEARGGRTESDAYVFVEYCDNNLRRVILIEPGMEGLPGGQCPRKEAPGGYVVRQATTLVVNVSEAAPSVLVRQGKAPTSWLTEEVDKPPAPRRDFASGRGLYGFGSGGIGTVSDAAVVACGGQECSGSTKPWVFSTGATFWYKPWLGFEAAWLKPGDIRLSGGATAYDYVTTLRTDIITAVGKVGVPLSLVRPYGFGGLTYARSHWTTTQTIDDQSVTIDGVETVFPGGTQTLNLFTQGWSWTAGGGMEFALGKRALIFTEGGVANIRGSDRQGGEGKTEQRLLYIVGGIRIRILG